MYSLLSKIIPKLLVAVINYNNKKILNRAYAFCCFSSFLRECNNRYFDAYLTIRFILLVFLLRIFLGSQFIITIEGKNALYK